MTQLAQNYYSVYLKIICILILAYEFGADYASYELFIINITHDHQYHSCRTSAPPSGLPDTIIQIFNTFVSVPAGKLFHFFIILLKHKLCVNLLSIHYLQQCVVVSQLTTTHNKNYTAVQPVDGHKFIDYSLCSVGAYFECFFSFLHYHRVIETKAVNLSTSPRD